MNVRCKSFLDNTMIPKKHTGCADRRPERSGAQRNCYKMSYE